MTRQLAIMLFVLPKLISGPLLWFFYSRRKKRQLNNRQENRR